MISAERKIEFETAIRQDIPRNVFVEVKTLFPRAAEQADVAVRTSHKAVTDGLSLSRNRQSRTVGLIRYNILDEAFEQILNRHGADLVKSVPVEFAPDEIAVAPIHLTTGVFGQTMIGFASHRDLLDVPTKNATRRALSNQNRGLSPDFFHPPEMFADRQRMIIIMVRRDPCELGKIASLTLSIMDSKQESYIYQVDVDEFVAGYGSGTAEDRRRKVEFKQVDRGFKRSGGEASGNQSKA